VRVAVVAAFVLAGVAVGSTLALGSGPRNAYAVHALVSDEHRRASQVDARLVNAWGLAASPTGPWWTSNEATATSTLYSGEGRKQLLTVSVDGGPTGIAYYGGKGLHVTAGGRSDPARFVYACEDGMLRAWTPTVPTGWSTKAIVVVDEAAEAAVFRGVAIEGDRVYATDFHNAHVDVYDTRWHRVQRAGAFGDHSVPGWYAPFGIQAIGGHLFVTYVARAPVNGNDSPTGGYVDEFDRNGTLVGRVAGTGVLNAPWGIAQAPRRRSARRQLRRRPHQRISPLRLNLDLRRHAAQREGKTAGRKRSLGARVRQRRHRRAEGHPVLRVRPARLAGRDRARRARARRRDQRSIVTTTRCGSLFA